MSRCDTSFQVSLLIFQAIMFAGAAFVDMYHLQSEGYRSRSDARKTFYHRVRLLYDYRYESDVVAIMHALLIVTYSAGETEPDLAAPQTRMRPPTPQSTVNTVVAFPLQPQNNANYMEHMLGGMAVPHHTSSEMQFAPTGSIYPGLCIQDSFPILH
jgi:hypothetical protein